MLNTYVIEGGIGKCTAFTALIPKLAEKAGEAIQIYTPYIDCFAFNPDVAMAYEQSLPITDPRIMASDNIYYCEPYKSNFAFGKQHLIEAYCKLFDVDYAPEMTPKLYTTHLKDRAVEWLEKNGITGKYMLVQFSGGQPPVGWHPNNSYASHTPLRNYPPYMAQQIINQLRTEYPNVAVVDVTLPNEPSFAGALKCTEHWAVIHEMLKHAEGFIAIDSCLNHFSASAKKSGVVLWGPTPSRVQHSCHSPPFGPPSSSPAASRSAPSSATPYPPSPAAPKDPSRFPLPVQTCSLSPPSSSPYS